jgi:acetylornithine deacetylase
MNHSILTLKQRIDALIRIASVSSAKAEWDMGNRDVINQLANWFEQLGFHIHIQELSANKANLIATYGQGSGGLVLSGHTDTVPFNESRWQYNPLQLTEADQRWYGLGTADMKSFFALIIEAVLPLLEQPFTAPLIILATADEESSMSGARALSQQQFSQIRAAIIGEPTKLTPINMHKSISMHALTITGQSGHSSNPDLGRNALDAMHDMMSTLKAFRLELGQKYKNAQFEVTIPTMNFGCIHGGDNPNRICNSCELHFDFRGLPGMSNADIKTQMLEKLMPIAQQHQVQMDFTELFGGIEAFHQEKNSELIKLAEKLTQTETQAVAFATEAPFLQRLGMETVVLGPGSIDQAHQPDEYIALDQITPTIELLRQFISHYCLQPNKQVTP